MRTPDGQEFWNSGEYHEIVLHEKIVSSMYFSDSKGNRVEPAHYGIEHEAIDGVHDVILFEDALQFFPVDHGKQTAFVVANEAAIYRSNMFHHFRMALLEDINE